MHTHVHRHTGTRAQPQAFCSEEEWGRAGREEGEQLCWMARVRRQTQIRKSVAGARLPEADDEDQANEDAQHAQAEGHAAQHILQQV